MHRETCVITQEKKQKLYYCVFRAFNFVIVLTQSNNTEYYDSATLTVGAA